MAPPDILRIAYEPDEWGRFHHIGRFKDGTQFMAFVTGAFPGEVQYPMKTGDWRSIKSWVAVMHKFDADGNYLTSDVRHGGFESEGQDMACEKAAVELEEMLAREEAEPCDIFVKPFHAEIDGIRYELVYERGADEENDEEWVMLWPNDIMFHPPWDSGDYST